MVDARNLQGHRTRYEQQVEGRRDRDASLQRYVGGGDAVSIGFRERDFLVRHASLSGSYVIDIGCGIGRLTRYLPETDLRSYLGTDIIPEVIAAAAETIQDPRFRFSLVPGVEIPGPSAEADIVCAYSVFPHLLDEQVFAYFIESRRILRSGGVAVFSFLDFNLPAHWDMFSTLAASSDSRADVLKFFEKSTLQQFARESGFAVIEFVDAGVQLTKSGPWSHFADGRPAPSQFGLGQSLLFLRAV